MSEPTPTPQHNPDVLLCLANLSNDEVFTPPAVVNAMLDRLPEAIWSDPTAIFLDPCCKSGVFLREAAKRLIRGLEGQIPDLQARLDHIFHRQLFALAITELTGLLARRSVYCSRFANGKYSLTHFETAEGNIRFVETRHRWNAQGRCTLCGATKQTFAQRAEQHAYAPIHGLNPQRLFAMKFDVILGNPPYQLKDGSDSASATPIYQHFVQQAIALSPKHLVMIIPSRWFNGGKGLADFRTQMFHDKRLKAIVDYFDPNDCFPGVDISGGVCYFHWQRDYNGDCSFVSILNGTHLERNRPLLVPWSAHFIRFNGALEIVQKVRAFHETSFAQMVSERQPFGLVTQVLGHPNKGAGDVRIYVNKNVAKEKRYITRSEIMENGDWVDRWKVMISYAYGERGKFPYQVIGKPFLAGPGSCCSETYLVIGTYEDRETASRVISYLKTRFVRFLILLLKHTQHATSRVYELVPQQDFSVAWTDEALYEKYGLTAEEQAFIAQLVKPMEA